MKRLLGWLLACFVLGWAGSYVLRLRHHAVAVVAARGDSVAPVSEQPLPTYAEVRQAREMVRITGPMADYVLNEKSSAVTAPPVSVETAAHSAADRVGNSPVGTSIAVLPKRFVVATMVNWPFEVPAHAANPQLRGTYRAFLKYGDALSPDPAEVELLLLNERQYAELIAGHPGDTFLSAPNSQEVATALPPTFDQPAKYYLVFRNNSGKAAQKVVHADFHIDF
jgi:hypothetical protein